MTSKTAPSATKLLIRLTSDSQMPIEWSLCDGTGCRDVQLLPREKLSELAALPAARETHLFIPLERTTCRTLELPNEDGELSDKQLHWLADETLDEGSPSLHWTLLSRSGTRLVVAGVNKEWLMSELAQVCSAGLTITKATLDALCLPRAEKGWTVLKDGDAWLIRTEADNLSRLTDAWLIHLLNHFPPQQLLSYGELPAPHPGTQTKPACHIMTLYTDAGVADLLHDDVRPPAAFSPWTAHLRRIALYSIALAAGVALLAQAVDYWQLRSLETQLRDNLIRQWQRYIPENRHSNNLRAYLPKQLQQRSPAPLLFMQRLYSSLAPFPDVALEGVSYNPQQKTVQLSLYARDESRIQQFMERNSTGFTLKIDKHEQGLWTLRND